MTREFKVGDVVRVILGHFMGEVGVVYETPYLNGFSELAVTILLFDTSKHNPVHTRGWWHMRVGMVEPLDDPTD